MNSNDLTRPKAGTLLLPLPHRDRAKGKAQHLAKRVAERCQSCVPRFFVFLFSLCSRGLKQLVRNRKEMQCEAWPLHWRMQLSCSTGKRDLHVPRERTVYISSVNGFNYALIIVPGGNPSDVLHWGLTCKCWRTAATCFQSLSYWGKGHQPAQYHLFNSSLISCIHLSLFCSLCAVQTQD